MSAGRALSLRVEVRPTNGKGLWSVYFYVDRVMRALGKRYAFQVYVGGFWMSDN